MSEVADDLRLTSWFAAYWLADAASQFASAWPGWWWKLAQWSRTTAHTQGCGRLRQAEEAAGWGDVEYGRADGGARECPEP